MEKKLIKLNTNRICLVLLLVNGILRLIFLRNINNPIETTLAMTGVLILTVFITIVVSGIKNIDLFSTAILAVSIGFDVMLYKILSPISNPFLWIAILSLVIIGLAIYVEENQKISTHSSIPKNNTLVSKKKNIIKKKILIAFFASMLLLPFFSASLVKASVIWGHQNLTSKNNKFKVTIYIYKHEDIIEDKEFYGFWILLHTDEVAYFDWIEYLELEVPGGVFDDWQPRAGTTTGGSISITPSGPSIGIGIPLSDVHVSGAYTSKLRWYVNPIPSNTQDLEFAAKLWIKAGTDMKWSIKVKAWSGYIVMWIWVYFWDDTLTYSTIPPMSPYRTYRRGGSGAARCYFM